MIENPSPRSADPSPSSVLDAAGDDSLPSAAPPLVNTAKLVQGMTQSELRVGMQTRDFGSIDIRTSLAHHEFSAQISVEHNEVARTLSTELPSLYDRLADQKVPVGNILIQSSGLSTSSGLAQESQQSVPRAPISAVVRESSEAALPVIQEALSLTGRLDIRI